MPATSTKPVKAIDPTDESKPKLSEAENRELIDQAIQKRERLAESQLEMAKLFIRNGKPEIALRRLKQITAEFGGSAAAKEAKAMMKSL